MIQNWYGRAIMGAISIVWAAAVLRDVKLKHPYHASSRSRE